LTSYTSATFVTNETAPEYRKALILCCLPLKFDQSTVRVDCAPALQKLKSDNSLAAHGIKLDLGNSKNVNKNPVAEKANQELEAELLRVDPSGSPVSAVTLLQAVQVLNSRIRSCGLSSREMLVGRDQVTGQKLAVTDQQLTEFQETTKARNHLYSAKCKARGGPTAQSHPLPVGALVYLKQDGDKFNARAPYMIVKKVKDTLLLQKSATSGFLSSKQYWVPNNRVFPISRSKEDEEKDVIGSQSDSSDSSDSDQCFSGMDCDPSNETSEGFSPAVEALQPSRRSSRNRSKPQRYGVVADCQDSVEDDNDLIPSWYPGWNKDDTRNYIRDNST